MPFLLENAHALIAAVANYEMIHRLAQVVLADARSMHDVLVDPGCAGYLPANVRLLLDEEASKQGLQAELAELAQRCGPEATAFIFFSGHGARIEQGPHAGEYLLPFDAQNTSPGELAQTSISTEELTTALRSIPARKVVIVLDCCHSGGIGQPKNAGPDLVKTGLTDRTYEAIASGRGRAILASSRSNEYSWVLDGAANSLFTAHLLAGLKGGASGEDGLIRIFDLFEYIQPRVTSEQAQQHPIFKAELEDNFPVALSMGGQKKASLESAQNFRHDAYLAFSQNSSDAAYIWQKLVPYLQSQGVSLAVSGVVEEAGVSLVVGVERAISQSKRTVLVLSNAFLEDEDTLVYFQATLAAAIGVLERKARILPLIIEPIERSRLPLWLSTLVPLNLADPYAGQTNLDRLVKILKGPVPAG